MNTPTSLSPDTLLRNSRTNSWILTVPNSAFIHGQIPAERAPAGVEPAPPRFDPAPYIAGLALFLSVAVLALTIAWR